MCSFSSCTNSISSLSVIALSKIFYVIHLSRQVLAVLLLIAGIEQNTGTFSNLSINKTTHHECTMCQIKQPSEFLECSVCFRLLHYHCIIYRSTATSIGFDPILISAELFIYLNHAAKASNTVKSTHTVNLILLC